MGRREADTAPMTKVFRRTGGGAHSARSGGLRGSWEDDKPSRRGRPAIVAALASAAILTLLGGLLYAVPFEGAPAGKGTPAGSGSVPSPRPATAPPDPAPSVTVTRWRTLKSSSRPTATVHVTVPGAARTVYVTPSPRVSIRIEHREAPTVRITVRVPGPTQTVWLRPAPEEIPGE